MVEFSPIVATTVLDFIDYAAFIVIFLIIYYGVKFAFFKTKEEEDAEKARIEGVRDWVGKKVEDYAAKREADKTKMVEEAKTRERRHLLEPAKGWVIKALQHADEVSDNLIPAGLSRARSHARSLKENLHSAKRIVRSARIHAKGDRRDYLERLAAHIEVIEEKVVNDVERVMPVSSTAPGFAVAMTSIHSHIATIKSNCSVAITSIDEFIDEDKRNIGAFSAAGSGRPAPRPYGSP